MVSAESVKQQLKQIGFNELAWGRSEVKELPHIILPDEEIYECVNGIYEGGFALLVATNIRVLLVDKKPMNYLTVEDLRFDMITEIDYSHRLFGARISISSGNKNLKFTSYNQPRLRKLITHVQHCMAEMKRKQSEHAEDQKSHLEQINQQLQAYLLAQHAQQEELRQQLQNGSAQAAQTVQMPKPAPELSDYLFAQSLLQQYQQAGAQVVNPLPPLPAQLQAAVPQPIQHVSAQIAQEDAADLAEAGRQEIFGKHLDATPQPAPMQVAAAQVTPAPSVEVNPLNLAYSKLPMALRNRKFGRPSFHAHSQQTPRPVSP